MANIANDYPDLNNELLKFIAKYNQSEAKGIIYEQLSDKRRNTLKSFVATFNFVETSKKLVDEIAKAGLTVQFAGGFDFIRTDGKAFAPQPDDIKLAMKLAKIWTLNPYDHFQRAREVMKYVLVHAEPTHDLVKFFMKLTMLVQYSPFPDVKAEFREIEAFAVRLRAKKEFTETASG